MNRFLRIAFWGLALLLAGYAAAFAHYLHAIGTSPIHSKIIWLTLAGAAFLVVAGWRFSLKGKFKIFAVLMSLLLVEVLLQLAALLGVLPAVNTATRAPYARVYWTSEGHGNSVRNRFGWNSLPFDLKAAHKVAYIGDSQVEALEVPHSQSQAAVFQTTLREKSPGWSVLGMGCHGSCPANSIEVLEYAARHFQPEEAIIVVSVGTDVAEASPTLNGIPPSSYIYHDLDADGKLALNPGSVSARDGFNRSLEFCHRPLLDSLPATLNSHCMTLQLVDSLRDYLHIRRMLAQRKANDAGLQGNGFNATPFAVNPTPEAQRALDVLIAQLQQCKNVCDQHGMKFRLVIVPVFPQAFYDSQHGRDWTMHIGDYDYFGPERAIAGWARTNGYPLVSMGEYIQQEKMDVGAIHNLYYANGSGHLTPAGHALIAQVVSETFTNDFR